VETSDFDGDVADLESLDLKEDLQGDLVLARRLQVGVAGVWVGGGAWLLLVLLVLACWRAACTWEWDGAGLLAYLNQMSLPQCCCTPPADKSSGAEDWCCLTGCALAALTRCEWPEATPASPQRLALP
jgi:hypothetical protein